MRLERLPGLRQVPGALRRPDPDVVLFESWRGLYADNPQAISEELHRRHPDVEQVWVASEEVAPHVPAWAEQVRPLSRAYLTALGAAGHVVSNIDMPSYFRKRAGASYLQTWHGSPLKRIAFDVETPAFAEHRNYAEQLARDVAKWDALVSQSPFATEVFRRAFHYDGPVLEVGYPRNDVLASREAPVRAARVRAELGIAPETRAILYAPTWRDSREFALELDLALLERRLGPAWTLLLRAHPHAPVTLTPEQQEWTRDVSGYPDVRDLFLAADVLVTDYSSVMFDFAVTGKPQLFFTYDLVSYRDQLRGFCLDFETEAPGPLVTTTEELAEALEDLGAVTARHADAYRAFAARYCPLDDGHASARVVQAMFPDRA